jgi:uncharacterized protein (UPF0335 family)
MEVLEIVLRGQLECINRRIRSFEEKLKKLKSNRKTLIREIQEVGTPVLPGIDTQGKQAKGSV